MEDNTMKLNQAGKKLFNIWGEKFYKENDRLGGNSADGEFVDGWCIIDNSDFIKSITDDCGLMIFGYDEYAIDHITECIDTFGNVKCSNLGYTFGDLKNELLKYFEAEE